MKADAAGRSVRQGLHTLLKFYLICFTIKNDKTLKETKRPLYHSIMFLVRVSAAQKAQIQVYR